jgi:hypothetical protein
MTARFFRFLQDGGKRKNYKTQDFLSRELIVPGINCAQIDTPVAVEEFGREVEET